jgi:hypothetical protein
VKAKKTAAKSAPKSKSMPSMTMSQHKKMMGKHEKEEYGKKGKKGMC